MTKKISILLLIVVCMFSMTLVGCGKSLEGEWELYATKSQGADEPKSVRASRMSILKFDDERATFEGDTRYYKLDGDKIYIAISKEDLDNEKKACKIEKFTSDELDFYLNKGTLYYFRKK